MSFIIYHTYVPVEGAEIFTVVYLPHEGGKFPTVLHRNPYYDRHENLSGEEIEAQVGEDPEIKKFIEAGYAFVFQHCRGTGKSTGEMIPYINERADSYAIREWVRNQPFYNGEMFIFGHSYSATVGLISAPFEPDVKGAILEAQDVERYNIIYRNGFFKRGLHGGWYMKMYKKKQIRNKNFTNDSYRMLPLSDLSKTAFGEPSPEFDETLKHPCRDDDFWNSHVGGSDARGALNNVRIPILLVTGFYDIYTGGLFDMWREMDETARSMCTLVVHPFDHSCRGYEQPIDFEDGNPLKNNPQYRIEWCEAARGKCDFPFERGKITYYKLFDSKWCCDNFDTDTENKRITLGEGSVTYKYNPYDPASFNGGLSLNFGGNAWQDEPNLRFDIVSLFTSKFEEDTYVKGKIGVKLTVSSDCEDTCFYIRLSICKDEGYYGIRDDINQISNFSPNYNPGEKIEMTYSVDEHAFVIKKGEKLRIDISSSAFPLFVSHTNNRGLFSEQRTAKVATNTVYLEKSYVELPVSK